MDITSILGFLPLYVVGFISLYSIIAWGLIFESRKNLSEGFIKTFATRALVGVGLVFLFAIWLIYVNIMEVKDIKIQIMNYSFLVMMIVFITWVAVSINKLGKQFGFKIAVNNIMKYIEKDKKKTEKRENPPTLTENRGSENIKLRN